jgi:hypothetical protein
MEINSRLSGSRFGGWPQSRNDADIYGPIATDIPANSAMSGQRRGTAQTDSGAEQQASNCRLGHLLNWQKSNWRGTDAAAMHWAS